MLTLWRLRQKVPYKFEDTLGCWGVQDQSELHRKQTKSLKEMEVKMCI